MEEAMVVSLVFLGFRKAGEEGSSSSALQPWAYALIALSVVAVVLVIIAVVLFVRRNKPLPIETA